MKYVIFSEQIWLKARKLGLVEFTDDEFERARTGNNLIRRGFVSGTGEKEVDMYIDPRLPNLELGDYNALQNM